MATKKSHGRSHGFKHKSRSVMTKKSPRGVSFLLREYQEGQQALVIIDPRQHKGLPHRRYHGKVGVITNVGRRAITLSVKLGNCLLYTSPSPRDRTRSRMPSSA